MPEELETAQVPFWVQGVLNALVAEAAKNRVATDDTYRTLIVCLGAMEIDDYPAPRCRVLGPTSVQLSWRDGPRSMRVEIAPNFIDVISTEVAPDAEGIAPGQLIEAFRRAFHRYHPTRNTSPRDRP